METLRINDLLNCWDVIKPRYLYGDESRKQVLGCYMRKL
nr:MAG TPA: hypothetical protein [Caudoviricetes sp.]